MKTGGEPLDKDSWPAWGPDIMFFSAVLSVKPDGMGGATKSALNIQYNRISLTLSRESVHIIRVAKSEFMKRVNIRR